LSRADLQDALLDHHNDVEQAEANLVEASAEDAWLRPGLDDSGQLMVCSNTHQWGGKKSAKMLANLDVEITAVDTE
jgi:hypothetical protein